MSDYTKFIKEFQIDTTWIPADVVQQLHKMWSNNSIYCRTYSEWLAASKRNVAEYCSYVDAAGYMHPPHGATCEYILENYRNTGKTKFVTGRYCFMWNNIGRLVQKNKVYVVSTCDRWVRVLDSHALRDKQWNKKS